MTEEQSKADEIYDQMCDLAHGRLTVDETYRNACSLMILALSKMEDWEREAELEVLGTDICAGLERLDAFKARKKLNGHGPKGGLVI